jgi:hypothetical protein
MCSSSLKLKAVGDDEVTDDLGRVAEEMEIQDAVKLSRLPGAASLRRQ